LSILLLVVGFTGGWYVGKSSISDKEKETVTTSSSNSTSSSGQSTERESLSANGGTTTEVVREITKVTTEGKDTQTVVAEVYELLDVTVIMFEDMDDFYSVQFEYVDLEGREIIITYGNAGIGGVCEEEGLVQHSTLVIGDITVCERPGDGIMYEKDTQALSLKQELPMSKL
jgi:hypothetical protein